MIKHKLQDIKKFYQITVIYYLQKFILPLFINKLNKFNKKTFIIIGIILLIIILTILKHSGNDININSNNHHHAITLNDDDVIKVSHGEFSDAIAFTGDLTPINQTIISAELTALVKKVFVQEGDFVIKNQKLIQLDDSDFIQALNEQEAMLTIAKSQFRLDKNKLEREKELYNEGFISKFSYDELKTNYQASLQKMYQQQSLLIRAKKQLANTIIKAPFSGYIYEKNIDNGELATQNNKLFALANLESMQINAPISIDVISKIKIGQNVIFTLENNNKIYTGKVSRINPVAKNGTRAYIVYIEFNNKNYQLKSGQFVNGKIILRTINDINYISNSSIRYDMNNKPYLLMVESGIVKQQVINIVLSNQTDNTSAINNANINQNSIVLNNNINNVKINDKVLYQH